MPATGGDHQGPGHANSRGAHGNESQLHRVVPLDSFPTICPGRWAGCHFGWQIPIGYWMPLFQVQVPADQATSMAQGLQVPHLSRGAQNFDVSDEG